MSTFHIQLADNRTAFSPGETLTGTVAWQLQKRPEEVMLQLVWNTQGKGTTDFEVAETVPFPNPQAHDTRPFTVRLPDSPYSFSGQLISLIWNLELNVKPDDESHAVEITIAPDGKEVILPHIQPLKK